MYGNCTGKGPEGWESANSWPSPYCKGPDNCGPGQSASRFNEYFDPDLRQGQGQGKGQDPGPTLLTVLGGNNEVAKYVVAALLNYAAGSVPATVLRESTIKHIWSEFATTAAFTPMPGASWSQLEIVDYLKSTMTSA